LNKTKRQKRVKQFGVCFVCKRVLPLSDLEMVEFYDGHDGTTKDFHHKLICKGCIKKAYDVYHSGEKIK